MSLGVRGGRRFNVSMVRRASWGERGGRRGGMGRTKQLVGWREGRTEVPPPANQKWTARRHETNSHNFISTLAASESQARQTAVGRPKKRAGEAGWRGNINIQFLLLIVIQIILSFLPRSPRSYARPMDGWMDRRWMVDTWGMGGRRRARAGGDGRLSSYFKRRRNAVRFFIVSHKMPRIPEDCKYLEVFRSGKRGRRRSSFPHGT